MGYFPNGAAGAKYEEEHCVHCVHYCDKDGCAVWWAHLLYDYDQNDNETVAEILSLLIPMEGTENRQCNMFIEKGRMT